MSSLGPRGGTDVFKKRRAILLEKIKGGVAVLFSAPEVIRNNDVSFPFRQDSSFYYLTGFTEPESALVLDPQSATPFTLFVREKDSNREMWDGFRYGLEGAKKHFGPDQIFSIHQLDEKIPELLKNAATIYYRAGESRVFDELVIHSAENARVSGGRTGRGVATLVDIKNIIGEMRLIKSDHEIELIKKAGEISARGHIAAMKASKPGIFEYQLEAIVESEFRKLGAERLGYTTIVGSGNNATTLHYITNTEECHDGELVLIDAGAEFGYLGGDITRTFPVNGKFSLPQKKFYETVLKVQKSCIAMVKPGVGFHDIHAHAVDGLVDGMLELGLLKGKKSELIESRAYTKYFPHGNGHWLGMDVHDSGLYYINGKTRKLEAGMCFTVEPGLYVRADDTAAPAEYRGLGVRIEDDVIVTSQGCDVITKLVPKEVPEIEALMASSP